MPAVFPPNFVPPTARAAYPHMARRDAEVWTRFLALYGDRFLAVAYDVALGGVDVDAPGLSEQDRLGWRYNTALKIDAVGQRPEAYWVIEVRPWATVSALGAAVAYSLVARRDRVFDAQLVPVIVCNAIQTDVRWAAVQLGVEVVEVPT